MADNTARISRLEKSHEDMSGKLDDIQDDTRYMRRQLDALKVEVREIPRVIVETVRESERRMTKSVTEAITQSEMSVLTEVGAAIAKSETGVRNEIAETRKELLAAIKALKS